MMRMDHLSPTTASAASTDGIGPLEAAGRWVGAIARPYHDGGLGLFQEPR